MNGFRQQIFIWGVLLSLNHSIAAAQSTEASTDNMNYLRNVIPPSPNAAALGKYVEWPVDLNTGTPHISIPLYELKGRTLNVPISLNYHASGIKVGEVASWVGLGWTLETGGVITRSVRGLPDECAVGYFYNRRLFPDYNYMYEQLPSPSVNWRSLVINQATNQADGVHDIYYFNAMGRSYKLLFKDSVKGVSSPVIQTIPYSNVVITTNFDTWNVTLEDGTKLVFGGSGCTEITNNSREVNCGLFPSSWYIQSITSTSGEKIVFKYTTTNSVEMISSCTMDDLVGWNSNFGNSLPGYTTAPKAERQVINVLHPDSIISETGFVKFSLRTDSVRSDLPNTAALSSMAVYSRINKQITPVDYFTFLTHQKKAAQGNEYTGTGTDYIHWRLVLDKVLHNGVSALAQIPQWKFTYNATALPSTLSYAQDHYGYYNGATANTSLLPRAYVTSPYSGSSNTSGFFPPLHEFGNIRDSNGTFMQAGMLTGITYPTGGSSQFTYEPNSYTTNLEQFKDVTISQSLNLTVNQTPFVNTKTITFTTTKPQYISLYLSSTITSSILRDAPGIQCYAKVTGPNMQVNKTVLLTGNGFQYYDLPAAGTYSFTIYTNARSSNFSTSSDNILLSASLVYSKSSGVLATTVLTGGLRVHSITDIDGINSATNISRYFVYSSPTVLNVVNPDTDYLTQLSEFFIDSKSATQTTNLKNFRNSSTRFALGSGGATIAYGKVLTQYGLNAVNGQTQTTFLNKPDVTTSGGQPNQAPYPDLDTREFERGLLLSEITLDASGKKIQATYNQYNFIPITQLSFFKAIKQVYYFDTGLCNDIYGFCNYLVVKESFSTEQVNKISSLAVTYVPNGASYDSLYTQTTYTYETPANTQATRTVTSNGRGEDVVTIQRTVFEKDGIVNAIGQTQARIASTVLDYMRKNNMVANIIQQEQQVGGTITNRTTTNYKVVTGKVVPDNVLVQLGNNTPETRVQFTKYDYTKGNLMEQLKTNDVKHNYLYDYNGNYSVADVINADSASIAYTSFEADGTGNWTIGSTRRATIAYTGTQSLLLLGESVTRAGLPTTNTYKVSYWALNGSSIQVNNTVAAAGDTRRGWTYYEAKLPAGSSSVTITGTGTIDELRLMPVSAQMTTYTYLPLIGIKSITDASNTTLFYDYDGISRLLTVRDDLGNVLKEYKYNYKQ